MPALLFINSNPDLSASLIIVVRPEAPTIEYLYNALLVIATVLPNILNHFFKFDTSEAEVLAVWTDPLFGDYVCVEPWWGIPDIINPNPELKDKPLIHSLKPAESEEKGYSIAISKIIC